MQISEGSASRTIYSTALGRQLVGDSRELLGMLAPDSVDLIVTSPPFALLREKSYGNKDQAEYVEWLVGFGRAALPVLKETGSLVIDLGGAYQRGRPVRSLYQFRVLLEFCDTLGYRLAEEFYWHNPAKLPSPIEWVNKRKIRVKDSVNTIWWFSKGDWPKADVRQVLAPYSDRMKKLIADPDSFYRPKDRPSGHDIGKGFGTDNGGAIPPNLLQFPNTDSNSCYLRYCKGLGREGHPARFPAEIPKFFIKFLTEPGDVVVDIFSGSNTTGRVAEELGRRWLSMEERRDYAALSAVRFLDGEDPQRVRELVESMEGGMAIDLAELARKVSGAAPVNGVLDLVPAPKVRRAAPRRTV
jgi:site-specific DNA-methyltransferase (cytosine-N4-specific)